MQLILFIVSFHSEFVSDSRTSVFREAAIFFPSFDICAWYDKEEKYFRNGYVRYSRESGIHVLDVTSPSDLKS